MSGLSIQARYRYVTILQEADKLCQSLKSKWEQSLDSGIEKQLREAYTIRNNAFVGLLREKVDYTIMQDFELSNNDISAVIIIIDGVKYQCRKEVLQSILCEEYNTLVNYQSPTQGKPNNISDNTNGNNHSGNKKTEKKADKTIELETEKPSPNIDEENVAPSKKADDTPLPKPNKDTKEKIKDDKAEEESVDAEKQPIDEKSKPKEETKDIKDIDSEKLENTSTQEQKAKQGVDAPKKEPEPEPAFQYTLPSEPEPTKTKETMLYDINDVGIVNIKDQSGEYVNFTIAPLYIPETGNAAICDIFVCMETENKQSVHVSELNGQKTIVSKIGDYEFIVKGSFTNGEFVSEIYPANALSTKEYVKEENKTSFVPKNFDQVGFGHVVDFIKNKDGSIFKVHAIPLDNSNNSIGMVNTMVCIENEDGTRETYSANNNMIFHQTKDGIYQIFGYWEDDEFSISVKLRNDK